MFPAFSNQELWFSSCGSKVLSDFLQDVKFWQLDHVFGYFANFLLRMCRKGHISTSSPILIPKFEIPHGLFPIRPRISVALTPRIMRVLSEKRFL